MDIKKNMGSTDRLLRTVAAVIMAYLFFSGTVTGALGTLLIILAIVFAATSLFGFCPLYLLFNFNTCPKKQGGV
jgi:hypothetical protein